MSGRWWTDADVRVVSDQLLADFCPCDGEPCDCGDFDREAAVALDALAPTVERIRREAVTADRHAAAREHLEQFAPAGAMSRAWLRERADRIEACDE